MPTITLNNANWQSGVNVNIRVGPNQDVMQNQALPSINLAFNQRWSTDTGDYDLFYQRDADPDHPNGQMTQWEDVSSANGDQTFDV